MKLRLPETCESGESDSDIEFLKEVPGTFQDHVFVHRKVKIEVKDVDQKASVDVKIEETRRNLFHVNVLCESDCSEAETETSKVKKNMLPRWKMLTVENEKNEMFKNLARKHCLKTFVNVRKLPVDVV